MGDQRDIKGRPKGDQRETHPADVSWFDALADYAMKFLLELVDNADCVYICICAYIFFMSYL